MTGAEWITFRFGNTLGSKGAHGRGGVENMHSTDVVSPPPSVSASPCLQYKNRRKKISMTLLRGVVVLFALFNVVRAVQVDPIKSAFKTPGT